MARAPSTGGPVAPPALAQRPQHTSTSRTPSHATRRRPIARGPPAPRVAAQEAPSNVAEEQPPCLSDACRAASCGSVAGDQVEEVDADVKGAVPSWLGGTLFMNGTTYDKEMKHMFGGYAVVQKWRIDGGQVWSSHKCLETKAYKAYRESGKMQYNEFGTHLGGDSIQGKLKDIWTMVAGMMFGVETYSDNACVNIISMSNGKMLASSEPKYSHHIVDPRNLELQSRPLIDSSVKEELATAHHTKLSNGDIINIGTKIATEYVVQRIDPKTLECTGVRSVPVRKAPTTSWIHDFPATDDYVVIVEQPVYYNLQALLFGTPAKHVVFDWASEDGTTIHLVPLDPSREVRTFSAPSFFAFHYGNTFVSEDGKRLCFDVSWYEDPEIVNDLSLDTLRAGVNDYAASSLWRYELPLDGPDGGEVAGRCLAPSMTAFDFPTVNKEYRGKPHRFTYGTSAVRPTCGNNALCKVDVETGAATIWHEPGCNPAEPHFVPRPSGDGEDDGVILSSVTGADGLAFLLFLDGKTFQEVARAKLPYSMPFNFHGEFVPNEAT